MKLTNIFRTLPVLAAFAAMPLLAAQDTLQVRVPFAFVAGGKKLPAGDYVIRSSESGQYFFVLGASQSSIVTGIPTTPTADAKPSLMFQKHGGEEYLVGVQTVLGGPKAMALQAAR